MQTADHGHFDRMRLIYRVQVAYEDLRDTMQDGGGRAAVAAARRKFSLLNRALAMMAVGAAG
jgi:hypothetical protein